LDLKGQIPGRVAVKVADILRGKNKTNFLNNYDLGGHVVLINSNHLKFTGSNKLENKVYYNHSGYPGGMRKRSTKVMLEKYSRELIFRIIKGMIPHNKLQSKQLKRLHVFAEANNPYQNQKFIKIAL
jgi:large subunit ribosomal protein L13